MWPYILLALIFIAIVLLCSGSAYLALIGRHGRVQLADKIEAWANLE